MGKQSRGRGRAWHSVADDANDEVPEGENVAGRGGFEGGRGAGDVGEWGGSAPVLEGESGGGERGRGRRGPTVGRERRRVEEVGWGSGDVGQLRRPWWLQPASQRKEEELTGSDQLNGKTPKEIAEYKKGLHKEKLITVAQYIGRAFLHFQNKRVVMAAYNFK
uniref:Uncharacterized protein n=1 Tax=Oryza sativa subsp. japonica TaxID=39947 RepID=Q69KU8_ORYSJ|nr:hypothetical protein [Oryza sativa Japonica Group]BAD34158.1 hypothetical protein [Oryza sativa Japonica Group]